MDVARREGVEVGLESRQQQVLLQAAAMMALDDWHVAEGNESETRKSTQKQVVTG